MNKSSKLFLSLFLFLFFLSGSNVFASTTVNLIATNDMHGVLEASDEAIGVAQASAMKNSTENALLIDSGDATQGTPLATINKGADVIKLMNAAGYDCMVAGNHEFDYGSEQLLSNAQAADFPILSANAVTDSGTLLPATHIIEKAGKSIGFVGITTSTTNTSTNPALRPGVTFSNEITAAKNAIASLQGQVDTIVLLTHLGDDEKVVPVTSKQLLDGLDDTELSQVSAVLDGHSHTIESEPYIRDNFTIPVIQDQTQLSHIGKVAITFNDDGSISATEEVMDYDQANQYAINSEGEQAKANTQSVIDSVNESQKEITSQVVGQTETPLWGGYIYWDYAEPRIVETNFGDLVSDAFKDAAEEYAASNGLSSEIIGVVNGGGIANSINPGQITYGNILSAFNHGNMVVVIQSTPAELYQVLEAGLKTTGQDSDGMLERESVSGSFIQCSGFSYSYNPAGETGAKVTSVVTNKGTNLSRTDTTTPIIIGTQNYVQTSFENSEQLVTLDGEDTVISNYISKSEQPLNYPTNGNRISITNDQSPAEYSVSIPVYKQEDTDQKSALAFVNVNLSIDNGEYQRVQTDTNGNLNVTLTKGAHTLELKEGTVPVYVNNYSGAGTNFTKPGYYGLSFSVTSVEADIPVTELTLNTESVDLSTQFGSNTQTVTAALTPADTTDEITWSVDSTQIATIQPNGNSVLITGVNEGKTRVTATCGSQNAYVEVIVSNSPIIASDYYITDVTPDSYSVVISDVRPNRAITDPSTEVKQVSIFTWSDLLQNDMDCVVVPEQPGTGNYMYTFPINENHINKYYYDASDIKINVYASSEENSNGNLVGVMNYAYNVPEAMPSGLGVTPYCSNIGFVTPTVGNNVKAGAPDFSAPIEGIRVASPVEGLEVVYSVHVTDFGWMPSVSSGTYAGTMNLNKQVEAIKMSLQGPKAASYQLLYQTTGMDGSLSEWCSDGQTAGSVGKNLPIKAIQINLVPVSN